MRVVECIFFFWFKFGLRNEGERFFSIKLEFVVREIESEFAINFMG